MSDLGKFNVFMYCNVWCFPLYVLGVWGGGLQSPHLPSEEITLLDWLRVFLYGDHIVTLGA